MKKTMKMIDIRGSTIDYGNREYSWAERAAFLYLDYQHDFKVGDEIQYYVEGNDTVIYAMIIAIDEDGKLLLSNGTFATRQELSDMSDFNPSLARPRKKQPNLNHDISIMIRVC
jgi:hypothetical protein